MEVCRYFTVRKELAFSNLEPRFKKYLVDPRLVVGITKIWEEKIDPVIAQSLLSLYTRFFQDKPLRLAEDLDAVEILVCKSHEDKENCEAGLDLIFTHNKENPVFKNLSNIIVQNKHIILQLFSISGEENEREIVDTLLNRGALVPWIFISMILKSLLDQFIDNISKALSYVGIKRGNEIDTRIFTRIYDNIKKNLPELETKLRKRGKSKYLLEAFKSALVDLDTFEKAIYLSYLITFYRLALNCSYILLLARCDERLCRKLFTYYVLKQRDQVIDAMRQSYSVYKELLCSIIPYTERHYEDVEKIMWYLYHIGVSTSIDAYKEDYIPRESLEDLSVILLELAEVFHRILHLMEPTNTSYLVTPSRILRALMKKEGGAIDLLELSKTVINLNMEENKELLSNDNIFSTIDNITIENVARSISMHTSLGILKLVLRENIVGYKISGVNITPPNFSRIVGALYLVKNTERK